MKNIKEALIEIYTYLLMHECESMEIDFPNLVMNISIKKKKIVGDSNDNCK